MKLYRREDYAYVSHQEMVKGHSMHPATLDDLKAALAEHGYIAVDEAWYRAMISALDKSGKLVNEIKAAEGRDNG